MERCWVVCCGTQETLSASTWCHVHCSPSHPKPAFTVFLLCLDIAEKGRCSSAMDETKMGNRNRAWNANLKHQFSFFRYKIIKFLFHINHIFHIHLFWSFYPNFPFLFMLRIPYLQGYIRSLCTYAMRCLSAVIVNKKTSKHPPVSAAQWKFRLYPLDLN